MNHKQIDGWPTWLDVRRGLIVLVLIIAPAVMLSNYLPGWIQSYQISGEALWKMKKRGLPDEIIQPMLQMKGPIYFFKHSMLSEVQKKVPEDLFEKHHKRIAGALAPIRIEGSEYFFLPVLAVFYFIVWLLLKPHESRGWF